MNQLNQTLKSIQTTKAYYTKILNKELPNNHRKHIENIITNLTAEEMKILKEMEQ